MASLANDTGLRSTHPRTLADSAFVRIHHAILTGELEPGQRLVLEEVAQQLDLSPMPVREALRRLDAEGLVEHIAHRGARVTELSLEDLREVYEARAALESLAMQKAAQRTTVADAADIEMAFSTFKKAQHSDQARFAHTDFHFSLYRAAHSRWLMRLITPLWESAERYRLATAGRRKIDWRLGEHRQLMEAVLRHDAEAAEDGIYNHLAVTANDLADQMGGEPVFEFRVPRVAAAERALQPQL